MRQALSGLLLLLASLGLCVAAPQQAAPAGVDPTVLKEIFGADGGYGGGLDDDSGNVAAVINVVKEIAEEKSDPYVEPEEYVEPKAPQTEDNYEKPDNYVETEYNNIDKADVEVNNQFQECSAYTKDFGYECVPYYQCHNGTIITDGGGLIDIRGGFASLSPADSKCEGFLDVCCKDPDFVPPPPPKIVHKPKCGRRNVNGIGARISGFTEGQSQFGEWPHMCAVLHDKPLDNGETANLYKCGGSLIASGVILTAAHCVQSLANYPGQIKVRCGEWDTQQQIESLPHQDRYTAAVKIHPEFNPRNLQNDFALLFVETEFDLDFHVDTICLPRPNQVYDSSHCFATGWGKDNFGSEGEYQVVLKEVELNTVNNYQCEQALRSTRLGNKFKLDPSFMCAGGEPGKDTCKGDGGSPLVCPRLSDPTHFDQVGIVAWGIGCGETGTPGVYADVSKAACWIDMAMTCYYGTITGDYFSYWGNSQECGAWVDARLAHINAQNWPDKIKDVKRAGYSECKVQWLEIVEQNGSDNYAAEEIDLNEFIRDGTEGQAGTYTNDPANNNNNNNNNNANPNLEVEIVAAKENNGSY